MNDKDDNQTKTTHLLGMVLVVVHRRSEGVLGQLPADGIPTLIHSVH